jgi:AraC family transcriptional regulator
MSASDRNRSEYEKRVNRVLDHIRQHRDEELSLERLASVAGFSPFHFHRIFKSMVGENLREHVQRTRLEHAATALLTRPHVDVLVIALENGFTSASAFARAFKERFGVTASQWRRGEGRAGRKEGQADRKLGTAEGKPGKAATGADRHDGLTTGAGARQPEEATMNVNVETLPAWRVAYVRTIGPYGPEGGIPALWARLARWAAARDLWTPARICLGISHDDPKVTDPARCRYDAAIVIPADVAADGDVNVADMEGGKYAVAHFAGPAPEIGRAYDELFTAWLPRSGYQPDDRHIFELYRGEAFDACTGHATCDLCVPVRPL